jgi:phosphoribosylamine--glycine ligase
MADQPLVGVLMGSDNDFETMSRCVDRLKGFGIPAEVRVLSAHRTPAAAGEYARTAAERGLKVIIAAAGMAAHLAGAMAAHSELPIIGVPIAAGALNGFDALLSTVQMPPGVPVATVGVGSAGATNAAILAAQILAVGDPAMAEKVRQFRAEQVEKVQAKDQALQEKLK